MPEGKKYLLQTKCVGLEEYDGEKWIDEKELEKIKERIGQISNGCEICELIVKDDEGNLLLNKPGC